MNKRAQDLRAGDVITAWNPSLNGSGAMEVKRVHGPTRKDKHHVTIYFRAGGSTTINVNTPYEVTRAGE